MTKITFENLNKHMGKFYDTVIIKDDYMYFLDKHGNETRVNVASLTTDTLENGKYVATKQLQHPLDKVADSADDLDSSINFNQEWNDISHLIPSILTVSKAMATDATHLYFWGVFLDAGNKKIVATDGQIINIVGNAFESFEKDSIIPRYIVDAISKNSKLFYTIVDGVVEFKVSTTTKGQTIELFMYERDGVYPDYAKVIPTTNNDKVLSYDRILDKKEYMLWNTEGKYITFKMNDTESISSLNREKAKAELGENIAMCGYFTLSKLMTTPYDFYIDSDNTEWQRKPVVIKYNNNSNYLSVLMLMDF